MPKLTKRILDAAETQAAEYFVWDNDIPGFGLRVLPSGRKGYVVQYRAGRRSRRISLGPSTVLTCEQARTRAITIVAAARNGQDPAAERDAGRKAITIKELAERFDKEHIAIRVKASTGKEYRRNLQRFILPALGQLTVMGITRADVAKFHHDLRHIPYQANRCLEVISKMFSLSEMWGLRPDGTNPRKHIRKYPEEKRERFLSAAELRRIGEVLREMEAEGVELPSAILAARLLILTGCRLNEIMSLKWPYIELGVPALRLPDSKTGAKVVHVGQPVVDLLRDAQRVDKITKWTVQLNDALDSVQRAFAHRTAAAIKAYCLAYPAGALKPDAALKHAFADQIEQRVMPKLRGVDPASPDGQRTMAGLQELIRELGDGELEEAFERGRQANDGQSFVWYGARRKV